MHVWKNLIENETSCPLVHNEPGFISAGLKLYFTGKLYLSCTGIRVFKNSPFLALVTTSFCFRQQPNLYVRLVAFFWRYPRLAMVSDA